MFKKSDRKSEHSFRLSNKIKCVSPVVAICPVVENAIKYNRDNGQYAISNDGATITVMDRGIGMDPVFVEKLGKGNRMREGRSDVEGSGIGWDSIAQHCKEMGWCWKIESMVGRGTIVNIYMKEDDFDVLDSAEPLVLEQFKPRPLADILLGAEVLADLMPLAGYRLETGTDGRQIDITQSPIFYAITHARELLSSFPK